MGVKILLRGRVMTASIEGEIDHHTAKNIRETIDLALNKKRPSVLELDFQGISFMDSSGIGLIMGRYRAIKLLGGALKVINVPEQIERVIRLSGLGALGVIENRSEKHECNK